MVGSGYVGLRCLRWVGFVSILFAFVGCTFVLDFGFVEFFSLWGFAGLLV